MVFTNKTYKRNDIMRTTTTTRQKTATPLQAVRAKCLECSGHKLSEVRECPVDGCPLYSFRFGKRPATAAKDGRKVAKAFMDAES